MDKEDDSYIEESVYSNQEDCRRQDAADRQRQEEEEDCRCQEQQDLERQQQEEENCCRQEQQDLECQRQQELKGPTKEECAMFRILYSKFMGQSEDYLDTI